MRHYMWDVTNENLVDHFDVSDAVTAVAIDEARVYAVGRRCKLDPGFESTTRFQSLIVKNYNGAFNLNPACF